MFSSATVFAQADEESHALTEGAKALQFQITDNFRLSSFNGSAFTYKRHSSDDRAFRLGMSFGNRFSSDSFTREQGEGQEDIERDSDRLDLAPSLNFSLVRYTDPDSEIKFYYGYGPGISAQYRKIEIEDNGQLQKNTRKIFGVFALAFSGVWSGFFTVR